MDTHEFKICWPCKNLPDSLDLEEAKGNRGYICISRRRTVYKHSKHSFTFEKKSYERVLLTYIIERTFKLQAPSTDRSNSYTERMGCNQSVEREEDVECGDSGVSRQTMY